MKDSIQIRKAAISDLSKLQSLLEDLGYGTDIDNLRERFNNFISQDGYGISVAICGNDLAGFVAWSKSLLFVTSDTRIHIEAICVNKDYRGKGVGKVLMNHIEEIGKLNSPVIIDLTSGIRREKDGTHEFYKNLGYKNEGRMAKLYLRKKL